MCAVEQLASQLLMALQLRSVALCHFDKRVHSRRIRDEDSSEAEIVCFQASAGANHKTPTHNSFAFQKRTPATLELPSTSYG